MKPFLKCLILVIPFLGSGSVIAQTQGTTVRDSLLNEVSKAQAQASELAKQQQHLLLYAGLGILVLAALLVFYIYRNYTLDKQANLTIQAEKDIAEQQRLRAERSEQFEQQFLANMSREIRTPMNTVLGMTNLTLDTQLTPKQNQYLTAVKKSSENLLVIINDVLNRSRLGTGKMEPDNVQFRLSEQINAINDLMRGKAERKGLTLQTNIAKDVPDLLTGDPTRLNQVLINLCENAIKFTDKGTVSIVVEKVPDTEATLCFRVIDSGIGISADKVGKLLESFHQTDAGASNEYNGTDLGLSIAKTLVELEDGEIEVKRGSGSEFFFTITYGTLEEKAASRLRGISVLVAEDNEYNQVVITDTLESLIKDVKVDLAENGKIAVEKHLANDYDVILMDVQMPEMSGLEATEVIRKTTTGNKKAIPIIALTADVLDADLNKCFEAGMNDHIPKPFTRSQLLTSLAKFYTDVADNGVPTRPETVKASNLGYLREFCDGNEATMKKYIDIYLKVTPGNLEKIDKAAKEKDYRQLAKTVHAIKAQLNYMGMKETRKLAERIELCAKEQTDLEELPQLINKLQEDCKKSVEELSLF